jgi:hypothetical protein
MNADNTQDAAEPSLASAGSIAAVTLSPEEVKALEWAADEALRQADSSFLGDCEKERRHATLRRLFNRSVGR